jgi:predicted NAD/FAD-dependent oxidoreductase
VHDARSSLVAARDCCNHGRIEGVFFVGIAAAGRLLVEIVSSNGQFGRFR